MTFVVLSIVLIAASVLQTLLPCYPALGNAKVPFLLCVTVYYGLNRRPEVSLTAAVLAGFLQDALSGVPLGYSCVCFGGAAWVIGRFRETVLTEALVTQLFFGAVPAFLVSLVLYLLLVRDGLLVVPFRTAAAHALGSSVLGAIACPFVCLVIGGLDRLVGNVRSTEVEVEISGLGQSYQ
jgi:rod shape-determining protein MreD